MSLHNVSIIGDAAYVSTRIEHAETVETLAHSTNENKKIYGYSVICITGSERSGKSILAAVLTNKKRSLYISGKRMITTLDECYFGKSVNALSGSYVIDDAHLADIEEIKRFIEKVVVGGGSVILMTTNQLKINMNIHIEKLCLTHSGLLNIKLSHAV